MGPGDIIALAGLILTLVVTLAGLLIKSKDAQISELRRANEVLETKLEAKNGLMSDTVAVKQETIDELRRQLDRLMITAELQERFLNVLPRKLPISREHHE